MLIYYKLKTKYGDYKIGIINSNNISLELVGDSIYFSSNNTICVSSKGEAENYFHGLLAVLEGYGVQRFGKHQESYIREIVERSFDKENK